MDLPLQNSVVLITSSDPDNRRFGTGFIIHRDGKTTYVITCAHVVSDVGGPGRARIEDYEADVIALGSENVLDLAILKVEGLSDRPPLSVSISTEANNYFVTAGFQLYGKTLLMRTLRGQLGTSVSLTYWGHAERVRAWDLKIIDDYTLQPGYSGSPVVDEENERVIGIISNRQGGGERGLAISIEAIEKVWVEIPREIYAQLEHPLEKTQQQVNNIEQALEIERREFAEEAFHRRQAKRQALVNPSVRLKTHRSFFDRTYHLNLLLDHLTDPAVRLINVIGYGGYGKTALVSRIFIGAEDGALSLPDGTLNVYGVAYFNPRITGVTLERFYTDLGILLGEPYKSTLSGFWKDDSASLSQKAHYLVNQIIQATPDGDTILVMLDELENVLDDTGQLLDEGINLWLEACLTAGGPVKIVVTSRQELRLPDAVYSYVREIDLATGLPEADAMELLRALDPDGRSRIQETNEFLLHRVVQQTKGIPFALEKIVGMLRQKRQIILEQLLNDPHLFEGEVTHALAQHSYSHLGEDDKQVMAVLAIYNRPVPGTAVAFALANNEDLTTVETILDKLEKNYLIYYIYGEDTWALHGLDESTALSRVSHEDRLVLHRRAADYYSQLCLPEEQWLSLTDVEPQLIEFEHRLLAQQYEVAARLLNRLDLQVPPRSSYLFTWGHVPLAKRLREKLVQHLQDPELQWTNWHQLGLAYTRLGQMQAAIQAHSNAIEMVRRIADTDKEGTSLVYLGLAYSHMRKFDEALQFYNKALSFTKATAVEGNNLGHIGNAYAEKNEIEEAIIYLQQAAEINKEFGDKRSEAFWLGRLGATFRRSGQVDKAIEYLRRALKVTDELGDKQIKVYHLNSLGRIYAELKDMTEAENYYQQAMSFAREIGDRWNEVIISWRLGLLTEESDPARAVELMSVRVNYEQEIGHPNASESARQLEAIRARIS